MKTGTAKPVAAVIAPVISLASNLPSLLTSAIWNNISGVKPLCSICFRNWSRTKLCATSVASSPLSDVGNLELILYFPASIFSCNFSRPCSLSSSARSIALSLPDLIIREAPTAPAPAATPSAPILRPVLANSELCSASIFCCLEPLSMPYVLAIIDNSFSSKSCKVLPPLISEITLVII
ncbi:MAG: hypothetical protein CMB28_05680 [Euryarchaeota archaeon]|nr:hypothetical protein [Euryarchaeota archaeon]